VVLLEKKKKKVSSRISSKMFSETPNLVWLKFEQFSQFLIIISKKIIFLCRILKLYVWIKHEQIEFF
jgi:hypothetical protein